MSSIRDESAMCMYGFNEGQPTTRAVRAGRMENKKTHVGLAVLDAIQLVRYGRKRSIQDNSLLHLPSSRAVGAER